MTNEQANKKLNELETQTQLRGSNDNEYQIYVAAAIDLGWKVKTYEEWLNS